MCSGESSRGRPGNHRDLSLSLCSTWSEEGEEDVLLGLSLARARYVLFLVMWYDGNEILVLLLVLVLV